MKATNVKAARLLAGLGLIAGLAITISLSVRDTFIGQDSTVPKNPCCANIKEVTLTLDFLNPETKELIWRGWYVDEAEDANLREEKINEAVKRILDKFPPLQNNVGNVAERIT